MAISVGGPGHERYPGTAADATKTAPRAAHFHAFTSGAISLSPERATSRFRGPLVDAAIVGRKCGRRDGTAIGAGQPNDRTVRCGHARDGCERGSAGRICRHLSRAQGHGRGGKTAARLLYCRLGCRSVCGALARKIAYGNRRETTIRARCRHGCWRQPTQPIPTGRPWPGRVTPLTRTCATACRRGPRCNGRRTFGWLSNAQRSAVIDVFARGRSSARE